MQTGVSLPQVTSISQSGSSFVSYRPNSASAHDT